MTKFCSDLNHEGENPLSLSDFHLNNTNTKDGYQPYCKKCSTRRVAENRAKRGVLSAEDYVYRHEQRRAEEAELASTFERVERAPDSNAGGMYLDRHSLSLNQITSRIVFGRSPIKFKRAWE